MPIDLARVTSAMSPKQIRSIVESAQVRLAIWAGAVRSGKTFSSLFAFLIAVSAAPDTGLIVICGKTLQTIERNVIEPLQDAALFGFIADSVHHTRGSNTATILGRTVWLIGANDARAEERLRGLTACLAYVDEATLVPAGFWTMLLSRLSVPGARLLATTNPASPAHWLRTDFILRAGQLNLAAWQFQLADNPSLTAEYVAAISAEYVGLWYRRFILGEWVAAEGAVYDMFDPDRHVIPWDAVPVITRWLAVGIDYGTTNPTDAVLFGIGTDHTIYAVSEYRHDSRVARRQLSDPELSVGVRDWLAQVRYPTSRLRGIRPDLVVVDPAAASFRVQLHRDGVVTAAADNDVANGIRTVSSLLAADKLRIVGADCPHLTNEFPGYAWDDKAALKGEDKVIKVADHALDAARYGLHTTRSRWRPVVMPANPLDDWGQAA